MEGNMLIKVIININEKTVTDDDVHHPGEQKPRRWGGMSGSATWKGGREGRGRTSSWLMWLAERKLLALHLLELLLSLPLGMRAGLGKEPSSLQVHSSSQECWSPGKVALPEVCESKSLSSKLCPSLLFPCPDPAGATALKLGDGGPQGWGIQSECMPGKYLSRWSWWLKTLGSLVRGQEARAGQSERTVGWVVQSPFSKCFWEG